MRKTVFADRLLAQIAPNPAARMEYPPRRWLPRSSAVPDTEEHGLAGAAGHLPQAQRVFGHELA